MRITKKILSLLLVVSMLASFLAMTGFEALAGLQNQQKTDFGIHFDDTTRKLKVLQLPDIQTSVSDGGISSRTQETIRLLMQRYNPDVILLSGDQTQGGSTSTKAAWEKAIDRVYNTFTPYMKSTCKVIVVPGNHEYNFGSLNHQYDYQTSKSYVVDWDNNFSTIDLDGAPGAGNVTVSASSTNKAVALNFALFNSKGDEEDGYLRPGGDNDTEYNKIVNWYTQMNNTLASNTYSYKAQVTGQSSAYVPAVAMQHVILQEIYTTGALIQGDATNGVPTPSRYSHVTGWSYVRLDPANNPTGAMNEGPCPTWLYKGATSDLYNALNNPGNLLGMVFGHDHDNYFDVTDDNGFRFIMGGALTQENYNTDENPKGRYFEFTLDDATGEVSMTTEVKSYTQLSSTGSANVDEDRMEVINGDGVQFANTLSVPKVVYVGAAENLTDVRAKQEFGNYVQTQLLDYKTKKPYDQDLEIRYCLPSGATNITFSAHRSGANTQATIVDVGTETTSEGTVYKKAIKGESQLSVGEFIEYTVTYTHNNTKYEIRNSTLVESIKQPAGYNDWFRGWRESNKSKHFVDLAYVGTLSGDGAYSVSRDIANNSDIFNSNTYYNYSLMISDVDQSWVNHAGDNRFSMFRYSPTRAEVTEGQVSQRAILSPPRTDIYLDVSALAPVSATDSRLDTGVSIDFWIQKDLDRGFTEYVAGIGFYAGDPGFNPWGATVDPNDSYSTYEQAVTAENGSTGSGGTIDEATIFFYDSFARQQSLYGLGTTHVNGNRLPENLIGNTAGQYKGYPLVVDSKEAALALNGKDMTMYTGVRNKGSSDGGYRILLYAVAPYYLNFHTYDKGALRQLVTAEMMNPRKRTDYPNASDELWNKYLSAYQSALNMTAKVQLTQDDVDNTYDVLDSAIIELLNASKVADDGLALKGDYGFSGVSVPPILYVSGSTIQTAAPYTDRSIKFDVPSGATNVKVIAVKDSSEAENTAVTITKDTTNTNGTHLEYVVSGGTATANGAVYYKITYEMPEDRNKDGKNDEYQQYAASYVRAAPIYQGVWKMRMITQNSRSNNDRRINTHIYYDELIDASPALGVRGASAVVALYPVQGTDSFSDAVNSPSSSNVTEGYLAGASGDQGWAVGTIVAKDYGDQSKYVSWREADKVMFYNDRGRKEVGTNAHNTVYWAGLQNSNGSSAEYIVAHYYYNKQAVTSSTKLNTNITITHRGNGDWKSANKYITAEHTGYESWNLSIGSYYGTSQAGSPDPYGNSGGIIQYASQNFSNNLTSSGQSVSGVMQNAFDLTTVNTEGEYKRGYKEAAGFHQRYKYIAGYEQLWMTRDQVSHYVSTGVGFKYNAVDRAVAHEYIGYITNKDVTGYNKSDMDATWWKDWVDECFKAYVAYGNLWGKDFDSTRILQLYNAPKYRSADYTGLVAAVNKAINVGLTANTGSNEAPTSGAKETITNEEYAALQLRVNQYDDKRYRGQTYAPDMFVNEATDLINVIKNRLVVAYSAEAKDELGNAHTAHLDFRYQTIIDNYAKQINDAYDLLQLAPADYSTFDKYTNYYSTENDTILFIRDDQAGYNEEMSARNYANEKALASGIYTSASRNAFVNSLNIPRDLKKPSEQLAITAADGSGTLPRIYPSTITHRYANEANNDSCLYNTARNAYTDLEFRRAGEYYSANGTWSDGTVTYYANYNKTDRGASYLYTPVFKTSYNSLSADIVNGGYVVTDNKVKDTYNKGNNGDTNGNNKYDAGEIWVMNGAGEYIKAVNPWTDASWGGNNYGFKNAYEEHIKGSASTYQSTNSSSEWVLALYVEAEILPDIAAVDYYYEKLVPSSYDMSQLEIQQNSYAEYEKGGTKYEALAGYTIYDENGDVLTDGAQWYTADTWAEYQRAKSAQPSIIDGATLAENQDAINLMTRTVYQKRLALQLRPMEDFKVNEENAILGKTTFEEINAEAEKYYNVIKNKVVKVFALRADDPSSYAAVAGNEPLFKDHPYYKADYITTLGGLLDNDAETGVKDFAGKPMAESIAAYTNAVNAFMAKYNESEDPANINKADTTTLQLLLNKTWIPEYDKYGSGNYNNGKWLLGEDFDGSDWYSNWDQYETARKNALSYFNAESFDGEKVAVNLTHYGNQAPAGDYYVDKQGAAFTIDKDPSSPTYRQPIAVDGSSLDGTINKAAYDLVVAYYSLQYKKVSDYNGTIAGITGSYSDISATLNGMLAEKLVETVDVVVLNANGELETVKKSVYGESKIAELEAIAAQIAALENEKLGDKYNEYVELVKQYKNAIDKLEAVPVYLDGWNAIIAHLNEKAGDTATIADSGTMTAYFNAVYAGFNPDGVYAENGQSINNIFLAKTMYDSFAPTAKNGQAQYNVLITNLYNELKAASFVPKQVNDAAKDATDKLSQGSQPAYDPIQLNGRAKVQGISKYSPASVTAASNVVVSVVGTKVTLWDTDPTVTGYNNGAGVIVDGSLADEIWAAVGLTNASGTKDYEGADRDERYLLVEGGQFLDALNDAVEYAKGELYEDDGVTVKQFVVLKGDGTEEYDSIFTKESVDQLLEALAAAETVDETTSQADIDQIVFDILEDTDINNTIFLLAEDGTFYGTLNNVAEDEGLKYKPANYSYLDTELGTSIEGESDGAQVIIDMVWVDNGDGSFTLDNANGSKYFTSDTWTPYYNNYINALNQNIVPRNLTAKDQDKINTYTTSIYTTRNELAWNGIDDNTWAQIGDIGGKIGNLESETFTVLTFTNSEVQILEDGTRVLTAPTVGEKSVSAYGDVSHILSLWATFNANYLEQVLDITKQAEMLEKLQEIKDIYDSLETKRFDTEEDNEFTEGVRNLVDSFIAGTYTFNGFSSSDGIGTYVPVYQAVAQGTNVNAYEQRVRDEQRIYIQGKLNALYTIIGSGMEAGDVYIDHSTGDRYERAIDAVNTIASELYEYLTTTPAQYAGFGLEMRQDMYNYLSTTVDVNVEYRYAANRTVYTKSIPMFTPETLANVKNVLDGAGDGDFGEFGNVDNWPMISQLDSSVGLELNDSTAVEQLTFQQPKYDEETGETYYEKVYVNSGILSFVNGYSYIYIDALGATYSHDVAALDWLVNSVITDNGEGIYILADSNGPVDIAGDGALFYYTMDKGVNRDGDWYTSGYGTDINQDGTRYYLASHPETPVTGSEYNGWFTDATYGAVMRQRDDSAVYIEYSGYTFGSGPVAIEIKDGIENSPTAYGVCWNKANRTAYINAVKEDQGNVDDATALMYQRLCELELLKATDAYRYIAGLIYDALGKIPTYHKDNITGIIIPLEGEDESIGRLDNNEELGGRLFNIDLLDSLTEYTTVEDENGEVYYYSTQLPNSYNGGAGAVEAILALLQEEINKGTVTIDKADDILADSNSLKATIVGELEKLTLGEADFSKIISLTAAFLYNNPANDNALGSYDIKDDDVGTQFFETIHKDLAQTGNAKLYRGNELMEKATGVYHASGFYDFTKYKDTSLNAVIDFLKNNGIITASTAATAKNYNQDNKTGFNIVFTKAMGGTLFETPATQQDIVDEIYEELVNCINALELYDADTESLKEDVSVAGDIMLKEDIYDKDAVNKAGQNIWDEFVAALEEANNYTEVTVINQNQVLQAEDRLEKAIRALVLYVDTFGPTVTIHNTQTDLSKFYAEHATELGNTIASADQMVTASYMEAGLGGYTLYVYTNQLNPHIVVSLKDTTSVLNADGSTRTVTASKPEKMTVSAQAMNGVSANVITPVLDANTGRPLSSVSTKLTGATTMSAQTAKNAEGTYDADSCAYIILNPQFSDKDGVQQAAAYTINATDSAVTKNTESSEIYDSFNNVSGFNYASNPDLIETANGKVTVFVYYMNSMPADGSDSGFTAEGTANGTSILTYAENEGLAANEWNGTYGLLRMFNGAVKNWEFSDINADLNKGAVYIDPTFGENNFGSFIYKLDPTATSGLDYDVAKAYFEEGPEAAKAVFINALKSNVEYINAFDAESMNDESTKYIPFGANENWNQHLAYIDNGTLLFAHVADRFGNVCNRIIEVKNYDQLKPELTADAAGAVTVTEPGGSGVANVDLFNYMGTQGSSLYIDYLFANLHVKDFEYVSEDNTFTIKAGAASAGKLFTVAVTDNAGNVGSVPVYADENGDIVVTVVETFDNVANYAANDTNVDVNAGEDLEIIEFVFNGNETIKLNYVVPSSIVEAGPAGNVFANKKNVPLNITTKSEVEAIKLYNIGTGTEEIWTADNAAITDNGDGTKTWTVKYKFTEGEHNYTATAKVNGAWEVMPVTFSFTATTKSVLIKLTVAGIGKIRFGYNEGNYSNVPVMSQKTVPYGSVVTLEAVQTEDGSDFYYWINNGSNRIISAAKTYEFKAVTTMDLTTQFTTNECFTNDKKLVVYVNNAENVIENFELAEGEDYTVPAAPSLPDHVFKSWSMTKEEVLASDEMMIVVRPVYSLVVKNTVTLTEGNWSTTGAGVYESVDNDRALVSISASATNADGATFLYWIDAETGDIASYNRTYTFHAIKDTELTPVYGDASAVTPAPVARISTIKYDSAAKKVNFYAERSVPAGYDVIQTGIIVTKTASVGNDEAAFILDAAGVGKGPSKSTASNGYYAGAVTATTGTTVYARAYIIYQNADGDIITDYSPIASYTV